MGILSGPGLNVFFFWFGPTEPSKQNYKCETLMVSLLELDKHNQQFTDCQLNGLPKNRQQLMTENRATSQHPGAGAFRARGQRECALRDQKRV